VACNRPERDGLEGQLNVSIQTHDGHLVSHERPVEVSMLLMELMKASRSNTDLEEWSNVPNKSDDDGLILVSGSEGSLLEKKMITYNLVAKLQFVWSVLCYSRACEEGH
jgi:hypothetical protein